MCTISNSRHPPDFDRSFRTSPCEIHNQYSGSSCRKQRDTLYENTENISHGLIAAGNAIDCIKNPDGEEGEAGCKVGVAFKADLNTNNIRNRMGTYVTFAKNTLRLLFAETGKSYFPYNDPVLTV